MLIATAVTKSFGARVLFRDADVRLGPRDRLALVGPNGSGKTTLLEIFAGFQSPDSGRVELVKGAVVGYLAQETDALRGRPVLDEVCAARGDLARTRHRLEILEEEIAASEAADRDVLLEEYAHVQARLDELGGYTVEAEARRILSGLGFRERDMNRETETLSGGWLMRVALSKLLLAGPDVLLLDEPTNHLDLDSVVWLERFLRTYEGAVILVSHDRDFLNGFATKVIEIDDQRLVSYTGDYQAFVEQRQLRIEQQAAAAKNQAVQVERIQAFIDRFRYKSSKAKQVQSRIKTLDKMERVEAPRRTRKHMKLAFPPPPRAGRVVLTLDGVSFAYAPDEPVYDELSLQIERGDKIALVGRNGAGKTTLLKLAAGVLRPVEGERRVGHNVAVGYFAQHQIEALDDSNRVGEELQRAIPPGVNLKARDLLGRFLFSGDDVDKPVAVLSGGERTRLAMAKLLVAPYNVLCLDEPTNHLDIQSRDVLEEALVEWGGSFVLITHDRHLIRASANRIVEVGGGAARSHPGDYEAYLWRKGLAELDVPSVRQASADERRSPKERRRQAAAERARSQDRRRALRRVESELESVHTRLLELEKLLGDPDFYASGKRVAERVAEHEESARTLAALEEEWERLTEAVESDTVS